MIPLEAVLPAAAAGALTGLAVRTLLPARPDLTAVLDRLDAGKTPPAPPAPPAASSHLNSLAEKVGTRLLGDLEGRITLPVKDLALLRITPARHLGRCLLFAAYGFLLPQLFLALVALSGASLPLAVPLAASIGLAIAFWFLPGREVARNARAARLTVRHCVASYLERVALARLANTGAAASLTQTAQVGDGWIFARMRQVFHQAQLSGITPWDALKQLGDELDIPELARPAETLALAGDGAAVYSTLQAQARQLRSALLSDATSEANEASATMALPATVSVILMLVFVMIPVTANILGS